MLLVKPGARLGAYEITGEVGAGGMGVVFSVRATPASTDWSPLKFSRASSRAGQNDFNVRPKSFPV